MPSLVLTPKIGSKSKWDNALPTNDIVKALGGGTTQEYTTEGLGVGLIDIPNLIVGTKVKIRARLSSTGTGGTNTFSIRKADGVTILGSQTFSVNTTAFVSITILITNLTDFEGLRFFISDSGNANTVTLHQSTLRSFSAEFSNSTDILNILYLIDKVYMIGDGEYLQGVQTSTQDTDWVEVDYGNGAVSGLVFSANSGNLLFTWDGSIVGVSV